MEQYTTTPPRRHPFRNNRQFSTPTGFLDIPDLILELIRCQKYQWELHGIWVKKKYLYRGRGFEPRIWKISKGFSFSYCNDLFLVKKLRKSMVPSEFSIQFCIRIVCNLWMMMLICVWSEQVRRHNLARPTFAVAAHFCYFLPLSKFDHQL